MVVEGEKKIKRDLSPHERYLLNYRTVRERDETLARIFNGLSRSQALMQLVSIRMNDLADEDLVSQLSEEYQTRTDPKHLSTNVSWCGIDFDGCIDQGGSCAYAMRTNILEGFDMRAMFDENAVKKASNLSINSDLLRLAKALNINLSATLEAALKVKVQELRAHRWLEENQEAISAYNESVAERGVFSDGLRSF